MAIKKITLTEDHIKLIKNIKFDTFEMGDFFSVTKITDAIEYIEENHNLSDEFGLLRDYLILVRDKLGRISDKKESYAWGIDQYSIFGGYHPFEDMAMILGKFDEHIPGTEDNVMGRRYSDEFEEYMNKLYGDIVDNMEYIISLVLYYTDKGGLTPGTYKCKATEKNWTKEN